MAFDSFRLCGLQDDCFDWYTVDEFAQECNLSRRQAIEAIHHIYVRAGHGQLFDDNRRSIFESTKMKVLNPEAVAEYRAWLQDQVAAPMQPMDDQTIAAYVQDQRSQGVSDPTIAQALSCMKRPKGNPLSKEKIGRHLHHAPETVSDPSTFTHLASRLLKTS